MPANGDLSPSAVTRKLWNETEAARHCACTEGCRTTYFLMVNCMLCEIHLNKVVFFFGDGGIQTSSNYPEKEKRQGAAKAPHYPAPRRQGLSVGNPIMFFQSSVPELPPTAPPHLCSVPSMRSPPCLSHTHHCARA